jgi:hypothetical protein
VELNRKAFNVAGVFGDEGACPLTKGFSCSEGHETFEEDHSRRQGPQALLAGNNKQR